MLLPSLSTTIGPAAEVAVLSSTPAAAVVDTPGAGAVADAGGVPVVGLVVAVLPPQPARATAMANTDRPVRSCFSMSAPWFCRSWFCPSYLSNFASRAAQSTDPDRDGDSTC